jgi:hypothetical protein
MTDRGDYHVRFGNANDVLSGNVITSVTQNGRDNTAFGDTIGLFYAASNIEGAGANFYYLPVNRVSPTAGIGEVNINMAVGFFPYGTWLGGYARNPAGTNGGINTQLYANSQIRFGQEFRELGSGVTTLDLRAIGSGYNSSNGIVLANHAKNESNRATVQSNDDGTFTLRVRDNAQAAHSHGAAGDHFDEETSFHDDYGLPPGTFSRECAEATSFRAPIVCPFESRLGVAGFWAYRSWLWGYKHLPLLREFRDVSHIGVVHDDCVLMFKPVLQVSTSI